MKPRILIPCIVALAGLALFLARRPTEQPHRPPVAAPSSPASPTPVASAALPQPPTIAATDTTELRSDASSFPKFDAWTSRYLSAPADQRAALLDEGVALAKARRAALAALIPAEPRQALDRAVPMAVRQELPHEIVALLEERLNARGFFGVKAAISDDGNVMPIRREVRLGDGRRYDAFTYGRRATQQTTENAYFNGIAVEKALALDERPLRVLEAGERPDPAKNVIEVCPVSGKSTAAARDANGLLPAVSEQTPAVEVGGEIIYLCSGGHIHEVEGGIIAQEGGTGGPIKPNGTVPSSNATGVRSLIWMRVAFPETNQDPQSEASVYDEARQVNDFFVENAFGNVYVLSTVTPLLILPHTEAWYVAASDDLAILADARLMAKAAGYDPGPYDLDCVTYRGGPGSFGGQAYVGGKGCWLKTSSVGVAAHEFGHNFALWHANSWNTSGRSIIGDGAHVEYGNIFDTMGSAGAGNQHFNANHKNQIAWLKDEFIHAARTSGTYRIYQFDQPTLEPAKRYALKVYKDTDRDYWCEFRQKYGASNLWLRDGLLLNWSPWAQSAGGAHLLDTTPGSPDDKTDAALTIGRTFDDNDAGVHITPIGKGGTSPESLDLVVNLGTFPGNQAPTAAVSATATTVGTGVNVTFTAAATDPDGDSLAYFWDFGDKGFSNTNSPVVTKSWSTAGEYVVRCLVSDMKGKTASDSVIVRVGSPATFRISGTVSAGGQPLANVRVGNSLTGSSYRGTFTDSDGTYTITGLAAGTYTIAPSLYGYSFTTLPVTVGPTATGQDFVATDTPAVSLTMSDSDCGEAGVNIGKFTLTRTGNTAAALTVNFYYPSGTASKGTDYTLAPDLVSASSLYTATIPAGQATLDLVVTPVDDATAEGLESIRLELLPGTGYVVSGLGTVTMTLQDNDSALPVVSLRPVDTDATEAGDPANFLISRTGATTSSLTVQFAASGTATNGTDYANIGTQIVIPAGASSVPLTISPTQDTTIEGDESVTVTISTNAAYIRDAQVNAATAYIVDDDIPIVTIAATDAAAAEAGADPGTFVITRTGGTSVPLVVYYTLGGSAHHGVDYATLPGVLTIPAGSTTGSVTITPIDDGLGEASQTVVTQLRAGTGYTVGAASNATVTITDNGDVPTVSVTATDGTFAEPGGTGTFRFTTTGTGSGNITVHYTVTGTAIAGTDYTALSGTVTMGKNTTSDVIVTPINDALLEDVETVIVTIDPDPGYQTFLDTIATLRLNDDDQPIVNVSNTTTTSFSEAAGTAKFNFSRTGATNGDLVVNYTLSGTATNGVDYQNLPGTLTIPAGATNADLTVTGTDDALAEGTETLVLTLAPGGYGVGLASARLYITDNETPSVQVRFTSATGSGSENVGTVNIPVTLSAASAGVVTVEYKISAGTANNGIDYTFTSGVLQFDPGITSLTVPLTIIDDPYAEAAQTVAIQLSNAFGAALGTSTHTYTINDNDALPAATVGFAATAASGLESVSSAAIVVSLSAAQASAVTVDYAVTGGTATSGSDYTLASGTLTFAAGETAKLVPNTVINDTTIEANETIIVTLSNSTSATLAANTTHTYTINDDDTATVTIAATDATASESGDPGTLTLSRTGSTTSALSVGISIGGSATNGADYQTIASTATIAAGQSTAVIAVTPINDSLNDGDETVIASIVAGAGYTIGAPASATVTIIENAQTITIATTDASAAEAGADTGTFTLARSGNATAALTVDVALTGSADGADYTTSPLPVTFAAGATSATLTITPIDDTAPEGPETVIATIAGGAGYFIGTPGSAALTIADDDINNPPSIVLSSPTSNSIAIPAGVGLILDATVADDGKPLPANLTTGWSKVSGPASVTFGSLTAPGTTAQFSANGLYVLRLTASDGALQSSVDVSVYVGGGSGAFTGQDINSPTPTGSSSVNAGAFTISGGGSNITGTSDQFYYLAQALTGDGEIRARIVSMSGGAASAKVGVMLRGDTTAGSRAVFMSSYLASSANGANSFRYRATDGGSYTTTTTTGTATFPMWVRVIRSGDNFSGYTSPDGQAWTQIGQTQAVVMNAQVIAGLAITSNNTSALCTAVCDNVTISSWPSNLGPVVNAGADLNIGLPTPATLDGTASDDGKPLPVSLTTTWSKVSGPGAVTFNDPSAVDTTATFSAPGTYVLRLVANDGEVKTFDETTVITTAPTVTVQASDPTATEFGLTTGAFTISRTGTVDTSLAVHFNMSGTATNAVDHGDLGDTVTIPVGQSSASVTVTPLADSLAEGAETVVLTLAADPGYIVGAPASAQVDLADLPTDAWRFLAFGADANNPAIAGDMMDPDGDGLSNLLECAFATPPLAQSPTQPILGMEGNSVTLTYQRATSAPDLTFTIEESSDLAAWSAANASEQILSDNGTVRVVKATVPINSATRKLLRLRVSR